MTRFLAVTLAVIAAAVLVPMVHLADAATLDDLLGGASRLAPLAVGNDQIGKIFAQGVEKQHGLDQNPRWNARVQNIGSKLRSANHLSSHYDFAVLATHDFNACSIYGGHIRVNEGLLFDTQNNDAEAAFAIAHEIAHNELGHNRESVRNFKIAYALELANMTEKMPELLVAGANAALAKRSRKNESAADLKALGYMQKAGYRTTGAISMARRIEAEHKIAQKNAGTQSLVAQRFNGIFDTHPEPAKRAEMAEDFYLKQKYGTAFKGVAGASDSQADSRAGDSPVIVAHPSLWSSPLRVTDKICGVGMLHPYSNEQKDVEFFLKVCSGNHLVSVTCDNDSHDYLESFHVPQKGTDTHFTFLEGDYADPALLMKAIQEGKTYASATGLELKDMNFRIGRSYPKVNYPRFTFKATLGNRTYGLPRVIVYRDGKKWLDQGATARGVGIVNRDGSYTIEDKKVDAGKHWYVIRTPGRIITSPITLEVMKDSSYPVNPGGSSSWQKGIVHYHSFYSDGRSQSVQEIWDSGHDDSVGFILMTDHADCLAETGDHAYSRYAGDCGRASAAVVPGLEYSLRKLNQKNHLLILNPPGYMPYVEMNEEEFFGQSHPDQVCIIKPQFHIGDDRSQTEMIKDATFTFGKVDATLKMWIKGSPFKDPIIWVNRHEVGRVVTTDDKWHQFTFHVPAECLNNGQNLLHMESFIPDRWHTFDDCEVKEIWIVKN